MTVKNNFPTIRPSLLLDFVGAEKLDPIVTFSRNDSTTCATYFDASGTLRTAPRNIPRFDYNPSTLAAQGFLIEESRTNLCLHSETLDNATWSKAGSTITANAAVAPTGATVADKLVENSSTGTHIVTQSISLGGSVDNSAYVISIFARASERTRFQLFDNAQASSGITSFDLSSGTVISGTGTITAVGGGWYRCSVFPLKSTSITSTYTARLISTGTTTSYTGDGTSGLFLWGAQLEVGAFLTSYIQTVAATVTRAADVASVNTLSPWFNATEGTLYLEFTPVGMKSTAGQPLVEIDNGTANERIRMLATSANQMQNVTTVSGATSGSSTTPSTTYVANTTYKVAVAVKLDDMQSFVGGVAGSIDTTTLIPAGLTTLRFAANVIASTQSNVWIRRLTYYPVRLTNTELQTLTNP